MANFGFIIDNRRCIGCHACTVACKSEHQIPVGVNRTWVKYIEKGEFPNSRRLFSVMRCNHCDDAPCIEICPVTALFRREDGIVDFDNRRCIGCKACMQACPYDALYIDPETKTAAKCNYCAHRVDIGLEPACVNACPTQAIISGDLDNPDSNISRLKGRHRVTARKVEKGTEPCLYYIEGDVSSLDPLASVGGTTTMWSEQVAGVGHFARPASAGGDNNDGDSGGQTGGEHALERLGNLLSLGESSQSDGSDSTAAERLRSHVLETVATLPRRAYDPPQKGILWGWQVTGYLWTKAIASGTSLVPLLAVATGLADVSLTLEVVGLLLSLLFLALTGLLLTLDLDQPRRFLYVLFRPQWRSWLTRGAYIITAFALVIPIYLLMRLFDVGGTVESGARLLLIVLAFLAAIYTAFLFAQAKGRDFWQSPVLPLHMLAHSVLAGGALFAVTASLSSAEWQSYLRWTLLATVALHLFCDAVELFATHPNSASEQVARMITHGRYRRVFWFGVVGAGLLLPFLMLASGNPWLMPPAGVLLLAGVYLSQHIWVRAPQHLSLS